MRTKNVYVGNQRVVSVLNPDEQTRYEYYYHTDHLGSTTYLTDRDGKLKEHIEYTPWGEGWIEQEQGFPTDYLPYKFTGKELDATGLYYYGARYYDPRISMWLSADPALGRYLDSAGEASQNNYENSVFNSKNLALYSYGVQNPIKYTDPDGRNAQAATMLIGGLTIVCPECAVAAAIATGIVIAGGVVIEYINENTVNDNNADSKSGESSGVDAVGNNNSTQASPPNPDDFKNDKKNDNESTKNKDLKKDNSNVPKPKDFNDPTKSPGEGWEWRGNGPPESGKGSWYNPKTGESLHPDLKHGLPKGPHWGYNNGQGKKVDIYPNGEIK